MQLNSHPRRLLTRAAHRLVVLAGCAIVCAMGYTSGEASADTLRTEVYQFQLAASNPAKPHDTTAKLPVYLRVSNANAGRHHGALNWAPNGTSTQRLALFEFFIADDARGVSLHRVRIHDRRQTGRVIVGPRENPEVDDGGSPASAGILCGNRSTISVDWDSSTLRDGLPGGRLGLVLPLAPGETIDTLIDKRLAAGELEAEVELRFPDGSRRWVVVAQHLDVRKRSPEPTEKLMAGCACPAASSSSPSSQVAVAYGWMALPKNQPRRQHAHTPTQFASTLIPHGTRAREPPLDVA